MALVALDELKATLFSSPPAPEANAELARKLGTAVSVVEDMLGSTIDVLWPDGDVPDRVNEAVLRYVQWSWSRAHGGSESYMPGGDDSVIGLGVAGIEKELRLILGRKPGGLLGDQRAPAYAFPDAPTWPCS